MKLHGVDNSRHESDPNLKHFRKKSPCQCLGGEICFRRGRARQ